MKASHRSANILKNEAKGYLKKNGDKNYHSSFYLQSNGIWKKEPFSISTKKITREFHVISNTFITLRECWKSLLLQGRLNSWRNPTLNQKISLIWGILNNSGGAAQFKSVTQLSCQASIICCYVRKFQFRFGPLLAVALVKRTSG